MVARLGDQSESRELAEDPSDIEADRPIAELEKPEVALGQCEHDPERLPRLEVPNWGHDALQVECAGDVDDPP